MKLELKTIIGEAVDLDRIKKVRITFDEYAEEYESWYSKSEGRLIKKIEERAVERLLPRGKGLEVGVGSGIFASALGVRYGIDPAEELLQLASSRGVKTVLGIAEMLPFKDESFDFLLFMFTISFLADPLEAFREARRVLEPNGKLIVCFIPKESPWGKLYRKKKAEDHKFYKQSRFYATTEVRELLEESEFRESRAVSTLFQQPGSLKEVEEPVEGTHKSAGLCCLEAVKV